MASKHEVPEARRTELHDGRTVAYIDIGDPDGYPVISNHGGLSCRLDVAPADASAKADQTTLLALPNAGSPARGGHTMSHSERRITSTPER